MDANRRFRATIKLDIVNSDESEFFNSEVVYADADYEAVVAIEKVMVAALNQLTELGAVKVAELSGGPKKNKR